jgi:hypothetical protein
MLIRLFQVLYSICFLASATIWFTQPESNAWQAPLLIFVLFHAIQYIFLGKLNPFDIFKKNW